MRLRTAVFIASAALSVACGDQTVTSTTTGGTATTTSTTPVATTNAGGGPDRLLPQDDDPGYRQLVDLVGPDHGIAVAAVSAGPGAPITVETRGPLDSGVAWSTVKVPMAMAVIDAGDGLAFAEDVNQALTASDNDAALRLWTHLGDGELAAQAVTAELRANGDSVTTVQAQQIHPPYSPYGQTRWALADQARFALRLPCSPSGRVVAEVMGHVVADQRWGLGTVGPSVAFKGGWGPGAEPGVAGGYFVRQFGLVTIGGREVGIAVASAPGDGSFDTGTRDLTAIAGWLVDNIAPTAIGPSDPCVS